MFRGETVQPEVTIRRKVPVYTPGEFDHRVATEPAFKNRIAGFTSVGFEHFKKGLNARSLLLQPYGSPGQESIQAFLDVDTFQRVVPKAPQQYPLRHDLAELLKDDRKFGRDAAYIEAVVYNSEASFYEVVRFLPWNLDHREQFSTFLLNPGSHMSPLETVKLNDPSRNEQISVKALLNNIGLEEKSLPKVNKLLTGRAGIQIVYEKSDSFTQFLIDNKAEFDLGEDNQSITLKAPIPSKYMLAVIPLGPAEQEALEVENGKAALIAA